MSLLDAFLLEFNTEGLDDVSADVANADKKLDKFEQTAKKAEDRIQKLGKAVQKDGDTQFKQLALGITRTLTPLVAFGKAIHQTIQFATDALAVAEAAQKAGLSIEQFQAQEGNKYQIFNREDVQNAKDFEMTMRDVRMGMASIGAILSRTLLPAFTILANVARNFIDFLLDHETFVKAVFIGLGAAILAYAIPAVKDLGKWLFNLVSKNPMLLGISLAIMAIALVIEDIYKWIHGEPSVAELLFGDFEAFKEKALSILNNVLEFLQPFIDVIKDYFTTMWELLKAIFSWAVDKSSGLFQGIGGFIENVISRFKQLGQIIMAVFDSLPEWLKDFIRSGGLVGMALKGVSSFAKNATEAINGSHADGLDYVPFDGYIAKLHKGERVQTASEANDWRNGLMAAKRAINFTASYPLNAIPRGAVSNAYNNSESTRTINIGDITIQTQATSAEGIANDLASAIKRAVISLDDGMLA